MLETGSLSIALVVLEVLCGLGCLQTHRICLPLSHQCEDYRHVLYAGPVHSLSDHSYLKYYSETWRMTGQAQGTALLGVRPKSFDSKHVLYVGQDASFCTFHRSSWKTLTLIFFKKGFIWVRVCVHVPPDMGLGNQTQVVWPCMLCRPGWPGAHRDIPV